MRLLIVGLLSLTALAGVGHEQQASRLLNLRLQKTNQVLLQALREISAESETEARVGLDIPYDKETRVGCAGDSQTWNAGWGTCDTYAVGQENENHCKTDWDKHNVMSGDACPCSCKRGTETETRVGWVGGRKYVSDNEAGVRMEFAVGVCRDHPEWANECDFWQEKYGCKAPLGSIAPYVEDVCMDTCGLCPGGTSETEEEKSVALDCYQKTDPTAYCRSGYDEYKYDYGVAVYVYCCR